VPHDIVIGKREVNEVKLIAVRKGLDILYFRETKSSQCIHLRSHPIVRTRSLNAESCAASDKDTGKDRELESVLVDDVLRCT